MSTEGHREFLQVNGRARRVRDIEIELGLSQGALWHRIKAGWPVDKACATPRRPVGPDYLGQRFGRLLITGQAPSMAGKRRWDALCDCGNATTVSGNSLQQGHTRSCGCFYLETVRTSLAEGRTTHGESRTKTWKSWQSMIQRCTLKSHNMYPHYGGRGISVCERWMTYENFAADMGQRPTGKTLDRYPDNKGNYEPGNCRWATVAEQNINRCNTLIVTLNGQSKPLKTWCDEMGFRYSLAQRRMSAGWPVAELFSPVRRLKRRVAETGGKHV